MTSQGKEYADSYEDPDFLNEWYKFLALDKQGQKGYIN
jgi:hypothetical protein